MRGGGEAERQEEAAGFFRRKGMGFSPLSLCVGQDRKRSTKQGAERTGLSFPIGFFGACRCLVVGAHHPSSILHGSYR